MTNKENIEKLEKQIKDYFNCEIEYNFKYEISHSCVVVKYSNALNSNNSSDYHNKAIINLLHIEAVILNEIRGLRVPYILNNVEINALFKNKDFERGKTQNKQISKEINNLLKIQILTHIVAYDILPYSNNQSKT